MGSCSDTGIDPPHRYKDLQGKRELRRARKSMYIYISVDIVEVLPGCIQHPFKLLQKLKFMRDKGREAEKFRNDEEEYHVEA